MAKVLHELVFPFKLTQLIVVFVRANHYLPQMRRALKLILSKVSDESLEPAFVSNFGEKLTIYDEKLVLINRSAYIARYLTLTHTPTVQQ